MPLLEISNVTYKYPSATANALTQINLTVEPGARFGLFGPNGAGKTTLIQLLTGFETLQSGNICCFGLDQTQHKQFRAKIGFVPQDLAFYPELNAFENLEFFGAWSGLNRQTIHARSKELLEILGLTEAAKKQAKTYSGGMKRRLNLAIGVIHNPELLFLDEPTVGVDVQSRHALIEYLKVLNSNGTTLFYTSHHLGEAEALCDHIALIDEGNIVAHGPISKVLADHHQTSLEGLFLSLTGKSYRD